MSEMFPPDENELCHIISELKHQLEDPRFEENWIKLHDELMFRESQLKELTDLKPIQNAN